MTSCGFLQNDLSGCWRYSFNKSHFTKEIFIKFRSIRDACGWVAGEVLGGVCGIVSLVTS